MKDKLYLKTPYKEHKDLTVPVTVIKYPVTPEDDYIVYSSLIDNTFSVKLNGLKTTPIDSEYVVDVKEPLFPSNDYGNIGTLGISKRLYIATAAMQGILASGDLGFKEIVKNAYRFADEMLMQEQDDN